MNLYKKTNMLACQHQYKISSMSFVWFDWKAIYEPWHVFPCWCKRCHHVLHNIYGAGFSISLPHLNKDNTITRCIKLEKAPLYNNLPSAQEKIPKAHTSFWVRTKWQKQICHQQQGQWTYGELFKIWGPLEGRWI